MLTSSFAATSAYLLHLFSVYKPEQEVLFINTGYHFEETLVYKEYLAKVYNLQVREVKAEGAEGSEIHVIIGSDLD